MRVNLRVRALGQACLGRVGGWGEWPGGRVAGSAGGRVGGWAGGRVGGWAGAWAGGHWPIAYVTLLYHLLPWVAGVASALGMTLDWPAPLGF